MSDLQEQKELRWVLHFFCEAVTIKWGVYRELDFFKILDIDKDNNNNKDNNDDKGILALWLERELWFSLRYQGYRPHDGDDKEDEGEVEDNNKYDDNNKDNSDNKSISALGLDRDLGFSLGHKGY